MKKESIDNIKNYGKEIQTIENFVDAVRKVPGMYIGKRGNAGFLNMIREVYQNSVDELMKNSSPCDSIAVIYNQDTKEVSVMDNGRGIPFDLIADVFTNQHTSSNYVKKDGEYSSGLHGVGAKVTNALSDYFKVCSFINVPGMCEGREADFVDGYLTSKGVYKIPNDKGMQGTIITFKPSFAVMGNITLTAREVGNMITGILYLTKVGAVVDYTYIINGKSYNEKIINELGVESMMIPYLKTPLIEPIRYSFDTGRMKANIVFTVDAGINEPIVLGYGNYCPTESGTHINGFFDGVVKFFRNYMNKIYLKESNSKRKNKITVNTQDIKSCLIGVVSVAHLEPVFTGQAKSELSNPDLQDFVRDLTYNTLEEWSKVNSKDLNTVCKHLKSIAEIRLSTETEKVKLQDRYKSNTLSKGLPAKYLPPNGHKDLELIICEGDSAAGSFKNSRDNKKQGLFPIRGKIMNAVTNTRKAVLSNEEVAGIFAIIGGGCGTKNFDINKVKWDKIIFATDADVDGGHISCLLLELFLTFCPEMIAEGKVYKAVPPLYGVEKGKTMKYLVDDRAYIDYVQQMFIKENKIEDCEGKAISKKEIADLMYRNIDYTYYLQMVADAYLVDRQLLELVCILTVENGVELTPDKLPNIKKRIKQMFRFVDAEIYDGRLVIDGLVNSKKNRLYMNDRMVYECKEILCTLRDNDYWYLLNGNLVSLYGLMTKFDSFKPKNITRYKGLGEMNPKQLAESTLHPDSNRTLVRYTISDAMNEIQEIIDLENNKKTLIKDIKVSRHDLV